MALPYDQPEAGDALAAAPESGEQPSKTITVPRGTLPGCAAGDTFKVVSADDNSVELQHVPGEGEDDNKKWENDFREHMKPSNEGEMSDELEKGIS